MGIKKKKSFLEFSAEKSICTYTSPVCLSLEIMNSGQGDSFSEVPKSFWDLEAKDIDGNDVKFDQYKGAKAFLVVNVASACGYTKSNYTFLTDFYKKYNKSGLQILAFPCNQFGAQEPKPESEIKTFCSTNYNVEYPLFSKIEVNGANTHPVYKYLRFNSSLYDPTEKVAKKIGWNFYKFLVDGEGSVKKVYNPGEDPKTIESDIEAMLK